MEAHGMQRRLSAIMSADVVSYSRLMAADEEGTLARLKAHREELFDPTIAEHQGRIVKLMGDGALVEFASVVEAVRAGVAIQRGMAERNADAPADQRIAILEGYAHLDPLTARDNEAVPIIADWIQELLARKDRRLRASIRSLIGSAPSGREAGGRASMSPLTAMPSY